MAYYLTRFDDIVLPLIQPITEMPTAPAQSGAVDTLGTGYDAFGADTAPATFPYPLQYRVLIIGTTAAAYMATVNALRAMARKRAYVYRTGQDGLVQRAQARLDGVTATDSVETFNAVELSFNFLIWSHWENNDPPVWVLDDGEYFDSGLFFDGTGGTPTTLTASPQTVTITVGGNVAIDDAIITITAGDAAITSVTVACAALLWTWTWTGTAGATIAATKSLVVDAGAWSVKDDGADAYRDFAFNSSHALEGMALLAPGANSIVVTRTGGGTGSTIGFAFADRWA